MRRDSTFTCRQRINEPPIPIPVQMLSTLATTMTTTMTMNMTMTVTVTGTPATVLQLLVVGSDMYRSADLCCLGQGGWMVVAP
jgi:hypothetical protein